MKFYRVVPGFVAQFGTLDSLEEAAWSKQVILDEVVIKKNERGTMSFARAGKASRGVHLYINLKNNFRLDTTNYSGVKGFPVVATVTKGMSKVDGIFSGYGEKPMAQIDSVTKNLKNFLNQKYPKLDSISKAYIVK